MWLLAPCSLAIAPRNRKEAVKSRPDDAQVARDHRGTSGGINQIERGVDFLHSLLFENDLPVRLLAGT